VLDLFLGHLHEDFGLLVADPVKVLG